jgi:hypothetical protein
VRLDECAAYIYFKVLYAAAESGKLLKDAGRIEMRPDIRAGSSTAQHTHQLAQQKLYIYRLYAAVHHHISSSQLSQRIYFERINH